MSSIPFFIRQPNVGPLKLWLISQTAVVSPANACLQAALLCPHRWRGFDFAKYWAEFVGKYTLDKLSPLISIPQSAASRVTHTGIPLGNTSSSWRSTTRHSVLVLAVLPAIDPVINQINTLYQPSIGPFSLLQAARGAVLLVIVAMAMMAADHHDKISRAIGRIVITVIACLTLFAIREFYVQSEVFIDTIVAFTQIAYWLMIWYVAASSIQDLGPGTTVIKGLIVGALITAASVYYGYATGLSTAPYNLEGVAASSGFFVSGKGIAGTLDAGALLAAYFSYRRYTWSMTVTALLCLGASFLTYARAGLVALVAALTWLSIWSVVTRLKSSSSWIRRLLVVVLTGAGVLLCTIGTGDLNRRWSDVQHSETAGSGRLILWSAALDRFYEGSPIEQLLGSGYQSMNELTYSVVGVAIHTHNDVLDMLLVGGFVGVLALVLVISGMVLQIHAGHLATPESATAVAIFVVLLFQGFFTGQLFLPDIMTVYVLGITAVLACRPTTTLRHSSQLRRRALIHV